ncbi:agamous-like MADS-box protein AGL75 [Eutrema salsugineum]|uniref:agamous-like MADS-box protein AGL75 n=1 Tax=Eutrema salsugineum TaxID=72664 RepID=UPI000CED44A9|nr:agamous-like MADS-box protein AGL75 [Eutrema salsugineum]
MSSNSLRFSQLDEDKRRKKSVDLYGFLEKNKTKMTNLTKKTKRDVLKYPISDHYSPDQISQLIQSLELSYSKLQERLRFLEAQNQKKTNLEDHNGLSRPMSLNHQVHQQTQSLNPSQFSLVIYNHEDATLSQIPLSASNFNQRPTQFTNYTDDYSMNQELYGCDQNMFLGNKFQHPCFSNTQDYSTVQESVNNYGLDQLMQHELNDYDQNMRMSDITSSNHFQIPFVSHTQDYSSESQQFANNYGLNQKELHGYDQNMCMSDITNSNVLDPCLSNTVSDAFCSDFQDPYGCMVGNTSFSQDLSDMFSSYGVQCDNTSSLLQTSTLPSPYTIPNC